MSVTSADADVEKSRYIGIGNIGKNRHQYIPSRNHNIVPHFEVTHFRQSGS